LRASTGNRRLRRLDRKPGTQARREIKRVILGIRQVGIVSESPNAEPSCDRIPSGTQMSGADSALAPLNPSGADSR